MTSDDRELELIQRAKTGDSYAQEEIVKKYEKLAIWAIPSKLRNDDEIQEAKIDAWRAINDFDPSLGSLTTLIVKYVKNGVFTRRRSEKSKKIIPKDKIVSLYEYVNAETDRVLIETLDSERAALPGWEKQQPISFLETRVDLGDLISRTELSEKEKNALLMHLQGMNNTEIGDVMNLSRQRISQIIKEILCKLKGSVYEPNLISLMDGEKNSRFEFPQDHLKMQRILFKHVLNQTGLPVEKITWELVQKYGLREIIPGNSRKPPRKAEVINRLLSPEKRMPDFCFLGTRKWKGEDAKAKSFDAMEYLVMNFAYIASTPAFDIVPWLQGMVSGVYAYSCKRANKEFQYERLKLDDPQMKRMSLLSSTTDNNSKLLGGNHKNAKGKVIDHLEKLENIINNSPLTTRERKILDLWVDGKDWGEIFGNIPEEFGGAKEKKDSMVRQEMGRIKNKIKLGAILLFPSYEEGADLEEIEKETSERFHSGKELSIFDRYFRLRLGAVIKEVARERKWKLEDFPYVAKNSHFHDRFGNIMEVFGHSVSRMALFAFPDLWKEWQFNFKGRWDGERGRERAFSAIEDILEKERSFIFTTAHCKKYRLRGMLDSFGKGNYIGINQLFCRDYWGKRINTNFEMHDRNRKLLALLFDARGSPYARKPKMSPEDITNFDRKNLYRLAGLSQSEELQWETRIEIWNYGAGYLKHIEVGKMTSLSSKVCRYHFNTTRERMTEIVSKMY